MSPTSEVAYHLLTMNIIRVQKWLHDMAPNEDYLIDMLIVEGLAPRRLTLAPGEVTAAQAVPYDRILFVLNGSMTFGFQVDDEPTHLRAGDRLEIPAATLHNAVVGSDGVTFLEARRKTSFST